ncbi:MAG: chemotaxis protein CheW, partial [Nitrospiria bacterium]
MTGRGLKPRRGSIPITRRKARAESGEKTTPLAVVATVPSGSASFDGIPDSLSKPSVPSVQPSMPPDLRPNCLPGDAGGPGDDVRQTIMAAEPESPGTGGIAPKPRVQESGPSSSAEGAEGLRPSSRIEEFLGFQLDTEEYCVWIRSVKEIIKPIEVTPVPRSPRLILGLISLRGAIVPIFDVRRRLGFPDRPVTPQSRVIVFILDVGAVGILVDRVTEVMSVDPQVLEPPPVTLGEREAAFVTATLRFKERLI